ncbi:MAG: hypothetical protein P8K68_04490 [Algibacter sp.]|uniref:hypothetical protein n=1 Tax=Algibacter sp. TaxID=1872428 RepID=UPI0026218F2B|nr:hypothetical protein [Algibacter sp.]MDG1731183.1 hypothetical protein [Algibacter sp.]MDG2178034.1 hypothetical protein [Algibacter sp.]
MKRMFILLYLFSLISLYSFSQIKKEKPNGLFYKGSLATTLSVNEENTLFADDDEPFFNLSALFVNNTLGYQFDKRTSIATNLEYNWHSQQGLHFAPAYVSLRHNIIVDDDNIFVRGGYGSLLGISKDFEKGNMYKLGLGLQTVNFDNDNSFLIGLDFTRKRFGYRTLEGLSSVSIFIEYMFF